MACGRLPARPPKKAWGGMGSGLPCSLCGRLIEPDHVETEFEDQRQSYRLHLPCMSAWEAVTTLGGPSSDLALQVLVDGGYSAAGDLLPETGPKR